MIKKKKNLLEGLHSRFQLAEERTGKHEDGSIKIIQVKWEKIKKEKVNSASEMGTPSSTPTYA